MNNIRIVSCFAGFTVSVSLFPHTSTGHKSSVPATVDRAEAEVLLRAIDLHGAPIANAHVAVRDRSGHTIASENTNQKGVIQLPRLAGSLYVFAVSVSGSPAAEFQSFFSVSPDQGAEIEVAFRDPCYLDNYLNRGEFTAAPFFIDGFQKDPIVVIGPYPIPKEPKS